MKKKYNLRRAMRVFLTGVMVCSASVLFAQVKIGMSPTMIGANNNLEVQATNGKKVIIHKNDGTLVFENTPPGAITDSVVTVNTQTGDIRAINNAKLRTMLGLSGSGSMSKASYQTISPGHYDPVDFTTVLSDELGSIDLANNEFVVKAAGSYTFTSTLKVNIPGVPPERANVDVFIQKFSPLEWLNIAGAQVEQNAGSIPAIISVSTTNNFVVGDRIRIVVGPCVNCILGNPDYTLTEATFFGIKHF